MVVWCSGNALVSINVVILHRARLVLGWVTFASSNRVRTLSGFNQPPRPTQPGHPFGVCRMSTGVKPGRWQQVMEKVWSSIHNTECLLTAGSRPWKQRWTLHHSHRAVRRYCWLAVGLNLVYYLSAVILTYWWSSGYRVSDLGSKSPGFDPRAVPKCECMFVNIYHY